MTEFIRTDILSLNAVSDVTVSQSSGEFQVKVYLSDFTRQARRRVFAKERSLLDEFPSLLFDFDVVDASQQEHSDAAHAE